MKGKQVVTALKVKWKVDQLYNGLSVGGEQMPIADSPWVLILQCLVDKLYRMDSRLRPKNIRCKN
jgi:hypothetical protein